MRIRDTVGDLIGVICIFGAGYGLSLLSYGAGF
jgi:hypothetical protein